MRLRKSVIVPPADVRPTARIIMLVVMIAIGGLGADLVYESHRVGPSKADLARTTIEALTHPVDPWGKRYQIVSAGEDGQFGTPDDITSE